jgi:hypothetical protein
MKKEALTQAKAGDNQRNQADDKKVWRFGHRS